MHCKIPLLTVASEIWSTAFRSNFLVYWAHCSANQIRSSRLDYVQHRAIHSLNACTKLVIALSEEEQLQVQRSALSCPSSGILTIEEAATILGIEGVKGTSSNGGAKGAGDGLTSISSAGARNAARILAFSRVAWVHEEVMTAWLGTRTAGMQIQALLKRLRLTSELVDLSPEAVSVEEGTRILPVANTTLHVCLECRYAQFFYGIEPYSPVPIITRNMCLEYMRLRLEHRRVCNAFSSDSDKSTEFNEIGCSSAMIATVCETCGIDERGSTHIRCAKRSSAALRSAVSFEEKMQNVEIETLDPSADACERVLCQRGASSESGIAARIRRDAKNALEQRATALACGEQPTLRINLLGKAVRIYGEWFALCSFCGACIKVTPLHRFGGEICCKRCDAKMLGFDVEERSPASPEVFCRYCGKQNNGASVWKVIKAPLDTGGRNANTPPPLRTVRIARH